MMSFKFSFYLKAFILSDYTEIKGLSTSAVSDDEKITVLYGVSLPV